MFAGPWFEPLIELPQLFFLLLLGVVMLRRNGAVRRSIGSDSFRYLAIGWVGVLCNLLIDLADELILVQLNTQLRLLLGIMESFFLTGGFALIAWGLYRAGNQMVETGRQFRLAQQMAEQQRQKNLHLQTQARELAQLLKRLDMDNAAQRNELLQRIADTLAVSRVSLWTYDSKLQQLTCLSRYPADTQGTSLEPPLQRSDYPRYFDALEQEFIVDAADACADPRLAEFNANYLQPLQIKSLLDAGIYSGERLKGVLCLEQQHQSRAWDSSDHNFVQSIAGLLSAAVSRSKSLRNAQALSDNERRFRAIADYTYDWESWLDPEGHLIWINPAAERISGYRPDEIYAMSNPKLLIDLPYRDKVINAMRSALEGGCGNDLEFELLRKDGQRLWVSMSWQSIYDDEGNSLGVRTSVRDISAQIRQRRELHSAMAELRNSSEQLQRHFLHSPMAIIYWDPRGRFIDLNPAAESIFGYSRKELMGQPITLLVPPEEQARVQQQLQQMRPQTPCIHSIKTNLAKGGRNVTCDWYEIPLFTNAGELESVVSFGLDITERVRFERAFNSIFEGTTHALGPHFLAQLTESMRSTLDVELAFVGELDERDPLQVNTVASHHRDGSNPTFSYSLIGTPCWEVSRDNLCLYTSGIQQRFPEDLLLQQHGFHSYAGAALRDQEQQVIGVIVLLDTKPILEPRFFESILMIFASRAGAELERMRQRRKQQKLERQVQHSQRMETLGVLTGGIAHDFNNLLQPISGYTELLLQDFPQESQAHQDLLMIKQGADRARSLIRQMMAFSRQVDTEMAPLQVAALIKDTIKFARGFIPTSIAIVTTIDPDLPDINGNRTQLDQALMNLVTNAFHAIGNKGEIEIQATRFQVTHDDLLQNPTLNVGPYIKISVIDNGIGMDSNTAERIFDPFFTTKPPGEGTGLGLSTTLGIIRTHGGSIDVYSEPGQGTKFTILLPTLDEPHPVHRPLPPPAAESPKRKQLRVLVVDDEQRNVDITTRMLQRLGYSCVGFTNSEQALQAFTDTPTQFQLILTDQTMPHLSGTEMVEKLRTYAPDIPVLIMTGYSSATTTEECERLRIAGVIEKPFDIHGLNEALQPLIEAQQEG